MSVEQGKQSHPILVGCAVIFAIVLVLTVTAGSMGYAFVKSKMAEGRGAMAGKLQQRYEHVKEKGKLSAEQQEIFGELVESVQRPESSFFAITTISMFFQASLTADEDEQKNCLAGARDLLEVLKKNPSASFVDLRDFMKTHKGVLGHAGGEYPPGKPQSEGE